MNEELIKSAQRLSFENRAALNITTECGCFACIRTFKVTEITQWTDKGQTALCPHCDIDAIVPDITDTEILKAMCEHSFRTDRCPSCGGTNIKIEQREDKFLYGLDELCVTLPVHICADCSQQWTDFESEVIRDQAVQKHLTAKS